MATLPTVIDPPPPDADEKHLTDEIGKLWKAHTNAQDSLKKTREEATRIRANLSKRLHELKSVLSRPGRGGAWFSFLESEKMPRSTADRLVRSYKKTLGAEEKSCATEQTSPEPSELMIVRYVRALWPKLGEKVTTPQALETFIVELRRLAEKSFGVDDEATDSSASDGTAQSG